MIQAIFLALLLPCADLTEENNSQAMQFEMKEVSIFDDAVRKGRHFHSLTRGEYSFCKEEAIDGVKALPNFKSTSPLYGEIELTEKYVYALDESKGTGKGYDLLYVDLDRDLNLAEEEPIGILEAPPEGAISKYQKDEAVCFNIFSFPLGQSGDDGTGADSTPGADRGHTADGGAGADHGNAADGSASAAVQLKPLEVLPRFHHRIKYGSYITFIPTKARLGTIRLGDMPVQAILAQAHSVTGRFDLPSTGLFLDLNAYWWGSDLLKAMHHIDGVFYSFSATPKGDLLTVKPYTDEMGRFEIGPGGREIEHCVVRGSLTGDHAVAVGKPSKGGGWSDPSRCTLLPVGEYYPNYITVELGRLSIDISFNYHSDGRPRERGDRPRVSCIKITKDKSYVLDFSNEPAVMFASPAEAQCFKPGDSVEVQAVLIDPELDIMIRGLEYSGRKDEYTDEDGEVQHIETMVSLDPSVTVTDASGEVVAEGLLPFG